MNGSLVGTTACGSGSMISLPTYVYIGKHYSASGYEWVGNLSDLRIYKGIAKYTEAFVPASTNPDILPDTPSGVVGSSKLAKTTAVYWFGTMGYMTTTSSDYNPGTGDFAIEGYFRFPDNSGTRRAFVNDTGTFGNNALVIRQYNTGFEFYCGGTSFSDSGYNMAQWNHAMITRSGSTVRIFVNGELRATRTTSQSISCEPTNQMTIGELYDSGSGSEYMRGYASSLRLTVGSIPTDYQTSSTQVGLKVFTPSFEPLTSTSQGATSSDVKLLCCQSPTSATDATVAGSLSTNNIVEGSAFNPFNTDINTVRGQESGYCTLNPLNIGGSFTLTGGKLRGVSSGDYGCQFSTIGVTSGKWYAESTVLVNEIANACGLARHDHGNTWPGSSSSNFAYAYLSDGRKATVGQSRSSYGQSWQTVGDTVGIAFDADNGTVRFYNNGVDQGIAFSNIDTINGLHYICQFDDSNTGHSEQMWNFGQKPFKFSPPDGFQPLTTANVRPVNVISRPDQYVGIRRIW